MSELAKKTTVLSKDGEVAAEVLAAEAQRQMQSLRYPSAAVKSLAAYAAVQLAQAQDHKEAKDWWDRCLAAAKTAQPEKGRDRVAEKRDKLRKLAR